MSKIIPLFPNQFHNALKPQACNPEETAQTAAKIIEFRPTYAKPSACDAFEPKQTKKHLKPKINPVEKKEIPQPRSKKKSHRTSYKDALSKFFDDFNPFKKD